MAIRFEKNTLRRAHRVALPAIAKLDGRECRIVDWSLDGFSCEPLDPPLPKDWTGEVVFELPLTGINLSFSAQARLRRPGAESLGFSFESLPERSKTLLASYIQANVEGRLDDIEGIIAKVDATEVPVETERPLTRNERTSYRRTMYARSLLYWLLGLGAVGLTAVILYFNFSYAVSTRGVISGALVDIAPEYQGVLKSVQGKEGDQVIPGTLLFMLDETTATGEVQSRRKEVEREGEELNLLYVTLQEEERSLGLYRSAASHQVGMLESELNGVEAEISLALHEFDRAESLLASGVISRSLWDERRKTLIEARARKSELEEELQHARVNAASARDGKYLSNGRTRGELREIQARIRVQEKVVEQNQQRLQITLDKLAKMRITSPVEGRIYAVKRIPGTFLRAGESVMTLFVTDSMPWVLARFTFEEARRLSPGDEALIQIPSMGLTLPGRIQAIGHHAMASGGASSLDMEISLSEVPVKILFLEQPPELLPGMGAEVRIRTDPAEALAAKLGLVQ